MQNKKTTKEGVIKSVFLNEPPKSLFFLPETTSNVSIPKSEFQMSYLNREATNRQTPEYISLYSDWDFFFAYPLVSRILKLLSPRRRKGFMTITMSIYVIFFN